MSVSLRAVNRVLRIFGLILVVATPDEQPWLAGSVWFHLWTLRRFTRAMRAQALGGDP